MDWPNDPGVFQPHLTVCTFDRHGSYAHYPAPTAPSSGTWPAVKRVLLFPVRISAPFLAKRMFWVNGAAVSGNVDAGIYDVAYTLLGHTGSTAQSGTSAVQAAALTANVQLGPGTFYLALVLDNTTGTVLRTTTVLMSIISAQVDIANLPLSATLTPAHPSQDYTPMFGMSAGSLP